MFSMKMKKSILMRMLKLRRFNGRDIAGEVCFSHAIILAVQNPHLGRMEDDLDSLSAQFLELRFE
jgi:hypothetical protein